MNVIVIDGKRYEEKHYEVQVSLDWVRDIAYQLKPMEVQRYYNKYLYRTDDGYCRACDVSNTDNNWSL